jgi:hypothetical protein
MAPAAFTVRSPCLQIIMACSALHAMANSKAASVGGLFVIVIFKQRHVGFERLPRGAVQWLVAGPSGEPYPRGPKWPVLTLRVAYFGQYPVLGAGPSPVIRIVSNPFTLR